MKYLSKKLLVVSLSAVLTLGITSCNAVKLVTPLDFNVLSAKGLIAQTMAFYYQYTDYMHFSNDDSDFEAAFNSDDYPVIAYDTIKGLKYCEEFGKYQCYKNYVGGGQVLISLKEDHQNFISEEAPKIIANNKNGAAGTIINYVFTSLKGADFLSQLDYTTSNNYDFYNDLRNGVYHDSYDYAIIDNPYAWRITSPDTTNPDYYYSKIQDLYQYYKMVNKDKYEGENDKIFYASSAIFVNKEWAENNKKKFKDFYEEVEGMTKINEYDAGNSTGYLHQRGTNDYQWETYNYTNWELAEMQAWGDNGSVVNFGEIKYNYARYTIEFTNDDLKNYLNEVQISFSDIDSLFWVKN